MAPGYRESIREVVDEVEREELLAAMAETSAKLDALRKKLDAMGDPTWIVALRVAGVVGVWGALATAGGWLLGVWGVVGVVVGPFVLVVLWAVVSHQGGKLIRGEQRAVGELSVRYAAGAQRVIFAWSGAPSALPLGLLVHLDRCICGWQAWRGPPDRLTETGWRLAHAARDAAEARLAGRAAETSAWCAVRGAANVASVSLRHNRLGIEYSTGSIGGDEVCAEEQRGAVLALVEYGLSGEKGEAFARAVLEIVAAYDKGKKNGSRVIRKLDTVFAPGG